MLPQPRLPQKAVPQFLDWGVNQKAPFGGAFQRINRLGSRYGLEITYPRLRPEPDGRILISRVRRALTQGAGFAFPQPGLVIGNPGTPTANGAQSGSVFNFTGLTPGYVLREGQFFSVIVNGRRHLHEASADGVANGSGNLTIAIQPMLRVPVPHGAVCEIAQPIIEGVLAGTVASIEHTIAKGLIPALLITERG